MITNVMFFVHFLETCSVGLVFSAVVFIVGVSLWLFVCWIGGVNDVTGGQRMKDLCVLVRRGISKFSAKTLFYFGLLSVSASIFNVLVSLYWCFLCVRHMCKSTCLVSLM